MGSSKDTFRDPLGFEGAKGGDSGEAAANAANQASAREIAELRRQFDLTQENIQPFLEAGQGQLGALIEGTTAEGLDARLGRIFGSENFQNLRDERTTALEGQLAAGGLTRSGTALQEAANIPTSLGFALEDLLTGRSTGLAGSGQNAAVGLGSLGAQSSGAIGAALGRQGQATASGILADQQANAAANQNLLATGAGVAALFFSDPLLKMNVEKVSEIGGLGLYQWDWIPEARNTMIGDGLPVGFMANEVREKYPEFVERPFGWDMINYKGLIEKLESDNMIEQSRIDAEKCRESAAKAPHEFGNSDLGGFSPNDGKG